MLNAYGPGMEIEMNHYCTESFWKKHDNLNNALFTNGWWIFEHL